MQTIIYGFVPIRVQNLQTVESPFKNIKCYANVYSFLR